MAANIVDELKNLQDAYFKREVAKDAFLHAKFSTPLLLSWSEDDLGALEKFANDYPTEVQAVLNGEERLASEEERDAIIAAHDALEANERAIAEQRAKVDALAAEASEDLAAAQEKVRKAAAPVREALQAEELKLRRLHDEREDVVSRRDRLIDDAQQKEDKARLGLESATREIEELQQRTSDGLIRAKESSERQLEEVQERYRIKNQEIDDQLKELSGQKPKESGVASSSHGCFMVILGVGLTIAAAALLITVSVLVHPFAQMVNSLDILSSLAVMLFTPIAIGFGSARLITRARSKYEYNAEHRRQQSFYEQELKEWENKRATLIAQQGNLPAEQERAESSVREELAQTESTLREELARSKASIEQSASERESALLREIEECEEKREAIRAEYGSQIAKLGEQVRAQEKVVNERKAEISAMDCEQVTVPRMAELESEETQLSALESLSGPLKDAYCLSLAPVLVQMKEEVRASCERSLDDASNALMARENEFQAARNISGMGVPFPEDEIPHLSEVIQKVESGRATTVSEALRLLDQDNQARKHEAEMQKRMDAMERQHQAELQRLQEEHEQQLQDQKRHDREHKAEMQKRMDDIERQHQTEMQKRMDDIERQHEAEVQRLQEEHGQEINSLIDELEDMEADAEEEEHKAYTRCMGCDHYEGSRTWGSWDSFRNTFCETAGLFCVDSLDCHRYRKR